MIELKTPHTCNELVRLKFYSGMAEVKYTLNKTSLRSRLKTRTIGSLTRLGIDRYRLNIGSRHPGMMLHVKSFSFQFQHS